MYGRAMLAFNYGLKTLNKKTLSLAEGFFIIKQLYFLK